MVTLSKPIGAGAPERNWFDVKQVFDGHKAKTNTDKVEKKTRIYSMSRRDKTLTGKGDGEENDVVFT